jgi:type III restriction enzyme
MSETIPQLIINSPYEEPRRYWRYDREWREFRLEEGRRPAGYLRATPGSRAFDDPGVFEELPLVNQIRGRVRAWREAEYPGVTGITKRLLEYWKDPEQRVQRLFFCQLEAIETLIWLNEAPPAARQGIDVPGDGGPFTRLCAKMATGSGKTIVMAMLIAYHVLNKAAYPQDRRFTKNVFVVAPGLTVKSRLRVLLPSEPGNFYDEFSIVPDGMHDQLRQGKVLIRNWHVLMPLDPKVGPRVVKKGPESDEAFTRRVLEELAAVRNILVINDEAHHAWRVPPKGRITGVSKDEIEEATRWIGGLDRIHATRGIITCYDLSATPFAPTGKQSGESTLFGWIVSDFSLNDAIESGLVKTPRIVVRDDAVPNARSYRSKLYHIYPEVRDDLNRPAKPEEPLPDLVNNAYYLLGVDWLETKKRWEEVGLRVPPVMISVANRTETAARIEFAFTHSHIPVPGLTGPERILRIDSKVLQEAEERDEPAPVEAASPDEEGDAEATEEAGAPVKKLSRVDKAELLRRTVDTIGRVGQPGEQIQNVISVQMLSEGWDARTVTHIMGLRAFESQLLCEQVVGRGLRRTSYEVDAETGLFAPEYVNIFGVPFTFLPHESSAATPKAPQDPGVPVYADPARRALEICWPNVIRIEREFRTRLGLDMESVPPLRLSAAETPTLAQLAPALDGKADVTRVHEIDLERLAREQRMQRITFTAARDVYDQMQPSWAGGREALLAQVIRLVERFVNSGRIEISPPLFAQDEFRRRIVITLNMNKLVQHIWSAITQQNVESLTPVFDAERPIRSTADMRAWYTRKPRERTQNSQINLCVLDSAWEAGVIFTLDRSPLVTAWAKNDHLNFEIVYLHQGVVAKYRPDFLVRLANGVTLIFEVKGQDSPKEQAKLAALAEWVQAVNSDGRFGRWAADVVFDPADVTTILHEHGESRSTNGHPAVDEALRLYTRGEVSMARAAELAGVTREELIERARAAGIAPRWSETMAREELA